MTDDRKMIEILKALAEVIAKRNTELYFNELQLKETEKALKKAEEELQQLKGGENENTTTN